MYKKKIKYVDYDGNEREEDFYFNLTKAEMVEMEMSEKGGFQKMIKSIIDAQDTPRIIAIFKDLILKAYGEKSLDGKTFIKVDKDGYRLANNFAQTEAYSILFMELATDADAASKFVNGVIPTEQPKLVSAD